MEEWKLSMRVAGCANTGLQIQKSQNGQKSRCMQKSGASEPVVRSRTVPKGDIQFTLMCCSATVNAILLTPDVRYAICTNRRNL